MSASVGALFGLCPATQKSHPLAVRWVKLRYDLRPFELVPTYWQTDEKVDVMFRIALKYMLVTAFVSGIVALIWLGHASDHIKHVDYVPPPITAPTR